MTTKPNETMNSNILYMLVMFVLLNIQIQMIKAEIMLMKRRKQI